jgi:hypothetical protein
MFKKLFIALLVCTTSLLFAVPSHSEETGYRYWGYFQAAPSQSTWTMAMTGPTTNVADGSVEGWIHTFSSDSIEAMAPRLAPNFFTLCSKVRPVAGKKRVGLVVDFGTVAIKPLGESLPRRITKCVQIDSKATGAEILAAATKIRAGASGFICGINGFPAKECSAEIKTPRILMKKS